MQPHRHISHIKKNKEKLILKMSLFILCFYVLKIRKNSDMLHRCEVSIFFHGETVLRNSCSLLCPWSSCFLLREVINLFPELLFHTVLEKHNKVRGC